MSRISAAASKSQSIFDGPDETLVNEFDLQTFVSRLFGKARADEGFLCLRSFPNRPGDFPDTDWIRIGTADQIKRIVAMANDAARRPAGETGRVFSPPVALFAAPVCTGAAVILRDKLDTEFQAIVSHLLHQPDNRLTVEMRGKLVQLAKRDPVAAAKRQRSSSHRTASKNHQAALVSSIRRFTIRAAWA